jgi:predicted transposase YbfD/YdcC
MTKSVYDMTEDERDVLEHAKREGLHVKQAGRHSGHKWYCFDCKGRTQDHIEGHETYHKTDHASFDSNQAIKEHMVKAHNVHWSSAYYVEEDAS